MKLLAIDTSCDFLGLAVLEDETVKASLVNRLDRTHASVLIPRIKEMLNLSGFSFDMLDGFVLDIGPGSFTGLRIGVATVKGFLSVYKKGIKLIKSLEVIAANLNYSNLDICTVLDAKKNNFYFCLFRRIGETLKPISKYQLLKVEELISKIKGQTIFLGDGLLIIKDLLKKRLGDKARFADKELWYPKPEKLGLIGYKRIKKQGFDNKKDLLPF
ncbi:MAG: tRNA (adenosine(37)-N6)-threonylcarbamoyltransferase complex dimerization subunit type 1 TsaB, partial [Candidatus Omnitrophica bacterium]|nr:tRNA (adenosine(37)-N6)-threonylcarbamoyltransferase complex dimerization subunit type 1 TsaB [Candidatus Omnitrophota bacterium]